MKKILILGSALMLGASLEAMTIKSKIDVTNELRSALVNGSIPEINSLLQEKELDLLAVDEMGNSFLHYAALTKDPAALLLLLDHAKRHHVVSPQGSSEAQSSSQTSWEWSLAALNFLQDATKKPLSEHILLYSGLIMRSDDEKPNFEKPENSQAVLMELNAYALSKGISLEIGVLKDSPELEAFNVAGYSHLKVSVFETEADAVAALKLKDHADALFIARTRAAELARTEDSLNCLNRMMLEGLLNIFLQPDAQKAQGNKLGRAIPFIDLRNKHSASVLHYAVAQGNLLQVTALLDRGANYEACATASKDVPGNVSIPQVLATCYPGRPLHVACQLGHTDIVKLLLARGADCHALDGSKRTPLHAAALGGHKALVCMLLEAGVDAKKKDVSGKTAQQCAHDGGHFALAAYLLTCNGGVNTVNESRISAMHYAAMANDVELAGRLKKGGALLNIVDGQGFMPIHYAAEKGNAEMLHWCLDQAPFIPSSAQPVLCVAARAGQLRTAEVLIDRGRDVQCVKESFAEPKQLDIFDQDALSATVDFDANAHEVSYMLWALEERLPDFIDLLIKKGVEETPEITLTRDLWKLLRVKNDVVCQEKGKEKDYPEVTDGEAFPIHYAAANDHEMLCRALLKSAIVYQLIHASKINFEAEKAAYMEPIEEKIQRENDAIDRGNRERRNRGFVEKPHKEVPPFVWSEAMQTKNPGMLDNEAVWSIITSACWLELEKQPDIMTADIFNIIGACIREKVLPLFYDFHQLVGHAAVRGSWQDKVLEVMREKLKGAFYRCLQSRATNGIYQGTTASGCALLKVQENKDLEQKERDLARDAWAEAQKERDQAAIERGIDMWGEKAFAHESKAYEWDQKAREFESKATKFKEIAKGYQMRSDFLGGNPDKLLKKILVEWLVILKDL